MGRAGLQGCLPASSTEGTCWSRAHVPQQELLQRHRCCSTLCLGSSKQHLRVPHWSNTGLVSFFSHAGSYHGPDHHWCRSQKSESLLLLLLLLSQPWVTWPWR